MPLIYLVAGEASGDALGARLIAALRVRRPDLTFAGIGGRLMEAQGLVSLFPMQEIALMGLLEVLPKLRMLRRRLAEAHADILARAPAIVITIDSPGFTLRLLRKLAGGPVPAIHYVAPQVWAWREGRVRSYHGLWRDLLCLLPFEPAFFARHGLAAHFVGHPVLESGADTGDAQRLRAAHNIPADAPVLLLLPGSRLGEVRRLAPRFELAAKSLRAAHPNLVCLLIAAPAISAQLRALVADWQPSPIVIDDDADKHDAFAAATAALTKSGTANLELALAGVPMVVAYRVNPVSAAIARRLITIKFASLVNLLSGRELVPELIQENATPQAFAAAIAPLLAGGPAADAQRAGFATLRAALTPPEGTPSQAAAAAVLARLA